jgi:hypothetical protein
LVAKEYNEHTQHHDNSDCFERFHNKALIKV